MVVEVIEAIRKKLGKSIVLDVRLSVDELVEGGLAPDQYSKTDLVGYGRMQFADNAFVKKSVMGEKIINVSSVAGVWVIYWIPGNSSRCIVR